MLLFALTTVAQPVYYTLFVSSCLRVPFGPTSLPEVPPPTSAPLKHWNLFVCCLLCFFFNLGRGSSGLSVEGQRPGKLIAMET